MNLTDELGTLDDVSRHRRMMVTLKDLLHAAPQTLTCVDALLEHYRKCWGVD
jgi:hypothetical protein